MQKQIFIMVVWAAGLLITLPSQATVMDLLPKVKELKLTEGAPFRFHRKVKLVDPTQCKYLQNVLAENGCVIDPKASRLVSVELVTTIPRAFNHKLAAYPDEAYTLRITSNTISIQALTSIGVIRAAQTLQQIGENSKGFSSCTIVDWPAFKLRGFMHDVGRSFISFEELKKQIEKLARFKVNTFHWHLTDFTGWRFEVKSYPQLTEAKNMVRFPGKFYTQDQCRELVTFAKQQGVTIIPEIDMPGHSHPFQTAMGFDMQTDKGVEVLKQILDEVCDVFKDCPYIHLGGDEVTIKYPRFLETMSHYVRNKGLKVIMWNPIVGRIPDGTIADMTQMWSTRGNVVHGMPNIDCRYNYTNHFDVYADLVGIYKSNIYYSQRGTDEVAGTISAAWNDTKVHTEDDITKQNNIYANILASAERTWVGGGQQYIEKGGTTLPNYGPELMEFADFERRFLFHKAHSLRNEPIAYVKQTNVRWRITDPFPNDGDNSLLLPPEQCKEEVLPRTFVYNGQTYGTHLATGAGIYLRHIWHPTVPSFYANPANNQTAYAWTYVYSEKSQDAGAQIEFYTYSRSGTEYGAKPGAWDRRGSKVWLNDIEIPAPQWEQTDVTINQNSASEELKNENLTARPVSKIHLNKGWNKVLMRLPHVNQGGTSRDKWQFTFVITDVEGRDALDGLIYSPSKNKDAMADF